MTIKPVIAAALLLGATAAQAYWVDPLLGPAAAPYPLPPGYVYGPAPTEEQVKARQEAFAKAMQAQQDAFLKAVEAQRQAAADHYRRFEGKDFFTVQQEIAEEQMRRDREQAEALRQARAKDASTMRERMQAQREEARARHEAQREALAERYDWLRPEPIVAAAE